MTQAVWNTLLMKAHLAAAEQPPQTMPVEDFIALYRQERISQYFQKGYGSATPNWLLMGVDKTQIDPALYLGDIFAVSRDRIEEAEYTVSLKGDPLRKIIVVHDNASHEWKPGHG